MNQNHDNLPELLDELKGLLMRNENHSALGKVHEIESALAAPPSREAVARRMPTYGTIPWPDLIAAVCEAQTGYPDAGWSPTAPGSSTGHQPVSMNMNSLNRIVSMFAAPQPEALAPEAAPTKPAQADEVRAVVSRVLGKYHKLTSGNCSDELRRDMAVAAMGELYKATRAATQAGKEQA